MIDCRWKTDGSSGSCEPAEISETPQADGYTKIDVTAKTGSPVNLMASLTNLPDTYYFQVRIVDKGNSVSVGVCTETEFQPGYKNKGMFYNGNLTNGSAALKTSFGPYLKNDDLVVLECTTTGNSFAMTIYLNGKKIGKGFEIAMASKEQRFLPCLAVTGKVELLAKVVAEQPTLSAAEIAMMHPLEGKWKIVDAKKDSTGNDNVVPVHDQDGNELPNQREIILDIAPSTNEGGPPSIRLSVHVFNSIGVQMQCTSNEDKTSYEVSAAGHPMTTMMMPPPPYDEVEQQLCIAITNYWQSFRLSEVKDGEANKLTITTLQHHVMAHCVRFSNDGVAALTEYHH